MLSTKLITRLSVEMLSRIKYFGGTNMKKLLFLCLIFNALNSNASDVGINRPKLDSPGVITNSSQCTILPVNNIGQRLAKSVCLSAFAASAILKDLNSQGKISVINEIFCLPYKWGCYPNQNFIKSKWNGGSDYYDKIISNPLAVVGIEPDDIDSFFVAFRILGDYPGNISPVKVDNLTGNYNILSDVHYISSEKSDVDCAGSPRSTTSGSGALDTRIKYSVHFNLELDQNFEVVAFSYIDEGFCRK